MNLLSEIHLKWYDDSSLMTEDRKELVKLFLNTIGASRDVAADIFEILLLTNAEDIALTTVEIKKEIIKLRKKKGPDNEKGLTGRNIQIWLKFFRDIELVQRIGDRYFFTGNKRPSTVFIEYIKPNIIDKTSDYIARLLEEIEDRYEIRK